MHICVTVSMITDVVATVATVAAVGVALWQTKETNKKSVSITATDICMLKQYNNGEVDDIAEKGVRIRVVNTGNRRIIIKDIGVYVNKNFNLQFLNISDGIFPKAIDIEEYFDFTITLSSLCKALNNNLKSITKPSSKIRLYITDSTGERHLCRYYRSFDKVIKISDTEISIQSEGEKK